ncbi:RNA binding protein, heterogenous nuclear RNP-K like protein [Coemansia javaensis]|uniref:RNA binding protein, heterogenous nuclear RNP-K like protein n=1 Tax=Coemansia javaensis TaxID=2761396 RepID=A0A9W8HFE2_9FUNG|nr:RNA binding protein, heterogenous nuclear RNP-K like protein [Coemansia javaensis]
MSDGPKRFSLSDYKSARMHARPAEAAAASAQKSELEELHLLLGTGNTPSSADSAGGGGGGGDGGGSGGHEVLRTPGTRSRSRSRSRYERDSGRRRSPSRDKISMRCVFPYEDGGIIIGLRGAHLLKLRDAAPDVDWHISNETNDRQDRILVIRGTVKHVSEAFCVLAEHFISQGMHIDYPPQMRGRGMEEVDRSAPLVPIRLLIPHKSCGAIIGQKSETLINTRVACAARRVYVYRERIADSRERVVEVVGTPRSIAKVMMVLGGQVARTLTNDQRESEPYTPERDGLRNFLCRQGVPHLRVGLESFRPSSDPDAAASARPADEGSPSLTPPVHSSSRRGAPRKRSRSAASARSRSPSRKPLRGSNQDRGSRRSDDKKDWDLEREDAAMDLNGGSHSVGALDAGMGWVESARGPEAADQSGVGGGSW